MITEPLIVFAVGFIVGTLMTLNNTLKVGSFVQWIQEKIKGVKK